MKNFPKNNYSNKNSKKNKKKPESKKIQNSSDGKNSSFKKYNSDRKYSRKTNDSNKSEFKDRTYRNDRNLPNSRRRGESGNLSYEGFSKRIENNYDQSKNKKNFDDWIWGKHSVYAALTIDRPINRIWCTSEIFSSEKFYLLLKDLKSKGVLIEEVS